MMRALFGRELDVIARRPAFLLVLWLNAAALAAFLAAWSDASELAALSGYDLYQQAQLVRVGLLVVLVPWTMARCIAAERGDDCVRLSVLTAVQPSRMVLARMAAAFVALEVLVLSGLPVVLCAKQIAAVAAPRAAADEAALLAVPTLACGMVFVWRLALESRLGSWLAAAGSTIGVALTARAVFSSSVEAAAATGAVGLLSALALIARADTALRYLSEPGR